MKRAGLTEGLKNQLIDEELIFELHGMTTWFPDTAAIEERLAGIEVSPLTPAE